MEKKKNEAMHVWTNRALKQGNVTQSRIRNNGGALSLNGLTTLKRARLNDKMRLLQSQGCFFTG
jgi:Tfp pilus assembly protein PilN